MNAINSVAGPAFRIEKMIAFLGRSGRCRSDSGRVRVKMLSEKKRSLISVSGELGVSGQVNKFGNCGLEFLEVLISLVRI